MASTPQIGDRGNDMSGLDAVVVEISHSLPARA
jgi:hypothetical protein